MQLRYLKTALPPTEGIQKVTSIAWCVIGNKKWNLILRVLLCVWGAALSLPLPPFASPPLHPPSHPRRASNTTRATPTRRYMYLAARRHARGPPRRADGGSAAFVPAPRMKKGVGQHSNTERTKKANMKPCRACVRVSDARRAEPGPRTSLHTPHFTPARSPNCKRMAAVTTDRVVQLFDDNGAGEGALSATTLHLNVSREPLCHCFPT